MFSRGNVSSFAVGGESPVSVTTAEALARIGGFAAADELVRLERELTLCVTGVRVRYLVSIIDSGGGVGLELSDGQRPSLGGVAKDPAAAHHAGHR
jgi:hypothetical protein